MESRYITKVALIAALYTAATLVCLFVLNTLAWGPVQLRLSEALVVLALFTPAAVPGLTLGCFLSNLIAIPISGAGALGMLDVVFGTLATFVACVWMRKFREKPALALLGPVLFNAAIVSAYLPVILQGIGFYTIPFTTITLDNAYIYMYIFGFISIAIGEALVVYGLGLPLYIALKNSAAKRILTNQEKGA